MQDKFDFRSVSAYYYTESEMEKISSCRIGIAGAGGLGSNCALALIRCGFNKFVIADFDTVSVSNLNRQQYFPSDLGKPKAGCLQNNLRMINASVDCCIVHERITKDNALHIFKDCDIIVEAFDNAESKAMIVSEMIGRKKLVVSASGIGGCGDSDRIQTRKIRDNFYMIGDGVSEVGNGVHPYAPCVMIAAAKQADVVLKWVLTH